jgi:hypothetical protein
MFSIIVQADVLTSLSSVIAVFAGYFG